MTAPGSAIPPQPGWWARTNRVGTIDSQYGWAVNVSGLMLPAGTVAAQYGWTTSITGVTPIVTYSATGAGGYSATGSGSWSHTAAAGDYVIACVAANGAGDITGVTYGGNAMTYLGRKFHNDNSGAGQTVAYGYLDTSGGTRTVAVTRSGTNPTEGSSVGYKHVKSVRCISTAFGSGGSLSHLVGQPFAESMAVHLFGSSESPLTPSGGTSRFNAGNTGAYLNISDTDTSTTFTATQSYGNWAGLSLILTPASVGNDLYVKGTNLTATDKTSIDIPAHVSGDLIILGVYRFNSDTLPSKPSASGSVPAWADINASSGADTNSMRTASFVATGTHTSGTWANATGLVAVVLSGQNASPIGGYAESGSASTHGATAPSVTMSQTDGSSVLLHFFGRRNGAAWTWSAPPAGYSRYGASSGDFVYGGVCLDTKDVTTSDGSVTNDTDTMSSVGYRGATVEVLD